MQRAASENLDSLLRWWIDGIRRFALVVVLAAASITIALFYYTAQTLTINTDTADMLSRELPFRQRHIEYQEAFPQFSDTITVVVEAETPDRADVAARELAERLRQSPGLVQTVFDIAGDPFFDRNGLLYLDLEALQDLADRLAEAQALLATLAMDPSLRGLFEVLSLAVEEVVAGGDPPGDLAKVFDRIAAVAAARAAGEPRELSWRSLLSGEEASVSQSRRFIEVKPVIDWSSLAPAADAIEGIRRVAFEMGLDESAGVRVRLTGGPALATEELQSVFKGATLAGIISFLLVGVLLLVGLRSVRLVAATLLTLTAGLIWTAAFAAAVIGHLNLISVAFAVLFIGLGVDFGIHFALRFKEEVDGGRSSPDALRRAAIGVGAALVLSAVAAAISFYSFLPTAYRGLAELGLISGTGMFIALFANFTLLPALLAIFGLRPAPRPKHIATGRPRPATMIGRHGGTIAVCALMVGLVAVALVPQVRFDFNPLNLQDPTTESVQTARDLLADDDATPQTISVLVESREKAAALSARLEELDVVADTVRLADFVPERQEAKLDIIADMAIVLTPILMQPQPVAAPTPAENRAALVRFLAQLDALLALPDVPADIARSARALERSLEPFRERPQALPSLEEGLLGLFPRQLQQLRAAMEASAPVTVTNIPDALRDRYLAEDGRLRVEVLPAEDLSSNAALRNFVQAVLRVAPNATDTPVVVLEAGDAVVSAILQASATAVALISVLLLLLLRSVRDMLLVLFPLALAAALTLATAVLLGTPFNFANLIVLPLLLGLGVASGIHLVMRARAEREGVILMRTSTPRAVVFSALTTIGSFGSLAVSTHRGTASMGELLTIAISYTLICTLIVLPALMAWLDSRQRR